MLLGLQGEAVHVDTDRGDVGVVLVRLHPVEVVAVTHGETVVSVQLDQGGDYGVAASHALHAGHTVSGFQNGAVPEVGVVEGLLTFPGVDDGVIARHEAVALHHPDELFARVVEVQLDLVGGGGDGLATGELQGVDQVLVGDLGEFAALISVQVDVVHVQGGGDQTSVRHTVADDVGVAGVLGSNVPAQVAQVVELQVDTHLVVLQGNQRQRQTGVAVEPELQGDVQSVLGGALLHFVAGVGYTGTAVRVARLATLHQHVHQLGYVTHHLGVAGLFSGLLGQLIPDVQPVTVVLVDTLSSDFDLDVLHQVVTGPVQPAELGAAAVAGLQSHLGQGGLQVHAVDQVTIALDGAGHLLAKVGGTVEGVFNGFHGKVSVATVHNFKKCDLRVTSQVHVLGAVGYELH